MNKKILISLAASILIMPHAIAGQGNKDSHIYGQVEGGIGGAEGRVFINRDLLDYTSRLPDETTVSPSFALRLGYERGLAHNWLWAIEAGYFYHGNTKKTIQNSASTLSIKQNGGDLLAVIKKQFDNGFNIYGKAGAAFVHQNLDLHGLIAAPVLGVTSHEIRPEIIAGAGYKISENLETNLSYSHIFAHDIQVSSNNTQVMSSSSLNLGLRYNFD